MSGPAPATVGARDETRARVLPLVPDLNAFAAWLLPFALVVFLAFSGGGYDAVLRGQVGVACWWLVAVGAATGAVSLRGGRTGHVALALLLLFAGWTAATLFWTQSSERTVIEIGRVSTYAAILVLALATQGRTAAKHSIDGLASGIAVVAAAAVLYRVHPAWFTIQQLDQVLPNQQRRLSFPVNYWNLLAGLAAMGIPLLLFVASTARTHAGRALAAAALPIVGLCIYSTVSRGAVASVALAVVVFLVLAPERPARVLLTLLTGLGTAILCEAENRRNELQSGVVDALAKRQGDELLVLCILVTLGVALVAMAVGLLDRHVARPAWMRPARRTTAIGAALGVLVAAVIFVVADGPGYADRQFQSFKGPAVSENFNDAFTRLSAVNGNGRWQLWQVARTSAASRPFQGTGAGTYEFVRAADDPAAAGGFVRDAHSLWFQTLGETGVIGLLAIVGLFLLAVLGGGWRAFRTRDVEHRTAIAGAVGAIVAFAVTATFEWAWQMTVLPAAAFVCIAVALGGRPIPALAPRERPTPPRPRVRIALVVLAVVAVVPVLLPLAATERVRASQAQVAAGDLSGALAAARDAAAVQPYAATPRLQEALVLERQGRLPAALEASEAATARESTNWRTWLVRSRLAARTGDANGSVDAYRRARALNPESPIFR